MFNTLILLVLDSPLLQEEEAVCIWASSVIHEYLLPCIYFGHQVYYMVNKYTTLNTYCVYIYLTTHNIPMWTFIL